MHKILMASLVVAGIGFVAAPATQAAPVNSGVLQKLTEVNKSDVTQVGYHSRYRSHWRWGSRGGWHRHHCGWGSRHCW